MMALLVRDFVLPTNRGGDLLDMSPEDLAAQWRNYEEWMSLRMGARSWGVSYTSIRRLPKDKGYLACNRIWLELAVLGGRFPFRLETMASLDRSFHLEQARATVLIDQSEMAFDALAAESRLFYRLRYEGQVRAGSQALTAPISLLDAVRPLVARRLDLKVGKVYRLAVLDSTWSLREGVAEVRVDGRETIRVGGQMLGAYRLVIQLGSLASTTWVSPEGEILRREFANNIVMERIEPQLARQEHPGIDVPAALPALKRSDFPADDGETTPFESEIGPLNLLLDQFRSPPPRQQ